MAELSGETPGGEMALLDHLVELRNRLLWALAAFGVTFGICMFFASEIFAFLLWPFEQAVGPQGELELIYTAPHEFFFTQIKLAMFAGLLLAFPFIAFQLYRFIAPGLYQRERRAFLPYLVASPLLFALGASLLFFLVMPMAFEFFLSMQMGGTGEGEHDTALPRHQGLHRPAGERRGEGPFLGRGRRAGAQKLPAVLPERTYTVRGSRRL